MRSIKQQAKLVSSLTLVIVFFIITTVLVPIDSDDWQNTFFAITMAMVVVLNGGCNVWLAPNGGRNENAAVGFA